MYIAIGYYILQFDFPKWAASKFTV